MPVFSGQQEAETGVDGEGRSNQNLISNTQFQPQTLEFGPEFSFERGFARLGQKTRPHGVQ